MKTIKELDLKCGPQTTNDELALLKDMPNLISLDLSNCIQIDDSDLKHLKDRIKLKRLSLFGCAKITDRGLIPIKTLNSLVELNLGGCVEIADDGLGELTTLASLKRLSLAGNRKMNEKCCEHQKFPLESDAGRLTSMERARKIFNGGETLCTRFLFNVAKESKGQR